MSHLSFARQISSLGKTKHKILLHFSAEELLLLLRAERVPGDEKCCVMVRGMGVVLDVLALLPHAEVVEGGGGVETHSGPFLFGVKRQQGCDRENYNNVLSSNLK